MQRYNFSSEPNRHASSFVRCVVLSSQAPPTRTMTRTTIAWTIPRQDNCFQFHYLEWFPAVTNDLCNQSGSNFCPPAAIVQGFPTFLSQRRRGCLRDENGQTLLLLVQQPKANVSAYWWSSRLRRVVTETRYSVHQEENRFFISNSMFTYCQSRILAI